MPSSPANFEREIEKAKQETLLAHLKVTIGDSHGHARLNARYTALDEALKLYRAANRTELDEAA